jgi:hypothetical protein
LAGTNTLTATSTNYAGLQVPVSNTITIIGSGALNAKGATGGAGLGGINVAGFREGGTISIGGSAQVTATSSSSGAGIGGGNTGAGGAISIGGNAQVMATAGAGWGAAIGGGQLTTGGTISISGGIVIARLTNAASRAAVIGSGGYVGGGAYTPCKVTISGGFVVTQNSSSTGGSHIGANLTSNTGTWDDNTNAVIISGGSVYAGQLNIYPSPRAADGVTPVFPLYVPAALGGYKTISVPLSPTYTAKTIGKTAARFLATGQFTPSGAANPFPAPAVTGISSFFPTALSATLWLPEDAYTGITVGGTGNYTATVTAPIAAYVAGGANRLLE